MYYYPSFNTHVCACVEECTIYVFQLGFCSQVARRPDSVIHQTAISMSIIKTFLINLIINVKYVLYLPRPIFENYSEVKSHLANNGKRYLVTYGTTHPNVLTRFDH
jgi:hypothetical protein